MILDPMVELLGLLVKTESRSLWMKILIHSPLLMRQNEEAFQ